MTTELQGVGIEYEGNPTPVWKPKFRSAGVEYTPCNPVPVCMPRSRHVAIEYKASDNPLTTGLVSGGQIIHYASKATMTDVELTSRIPPAVLLAISTVSNSEPHDAEAKWRYLLVQYINRQTNEIFNIVHRKVGANWDGKFFFPGTIELGSLAKRSVIIVAKTGPQLILLPTEFTVSENIHIIP